MFTTDYNEILAMIDAIDPIRYATTRNYIGGAVTKLSPYISRGVITTRQVAQAVLKNGYTIQQAENLLKELAWRDYFQQVWLAKGDDINTDLKQQQHPVISYGIPVNMVAATSGIDAIDQAITALYNTGYMHNHVRMYVAALCCNMAQCHWLHPARWMYYHLLDADWASNALSWQWVAGSFSSKKYIANQENINKYCNSNQRNTFLDMSYEALSNAIAPEPLQNTTVLSLQTHLPETKRISLDASLPIYIYNFYNLDPVWDMHVKANRILLLEPKFFQQYWPTIRSLCYCIHIFLPAPQVFRDDTVSSTR